MERAQEDDDIDMGKLDVGYVDVTKMNKKKSHHHHHPKNEQLVSQGEMSEPRVTNEGRPLDE